MSPDWRPTASLQMLRLRASLLAALRTRLSADGLLEVETPYLAHATVTEPQIESIAARLGSDPATPLYLQTSPEYAMKRLLAAGAGDIYQIARVFRAGERGRRHNPEFTLVEWYRHGVDHLALAAHVAAVVEDLLAPYLRLGPAEHVAFTEAVQHHAGLDWRADAATLAGALEAAGVDIPQATRHDRLELLDLLLSTQVTPQLGRGRLTILHAYPPEQAALARLVGTPPLAARFEIFHAGLELANGFHELADAAEQRRRFEADRERRRRLNRPLPALDERLLAALAAGLPDCAGVALGFDRLVMLAAGTSDIADVLSFPFERA